jgi:hypothetical protein
MHGIDLALALAPMTFFCDGQVTGRSARAFAALSAWRCRRRCPLAERNGWITHVTTTDTPVATRLPVPAMDTSWLVAKPLPIGPLARPPAFASRPVSGLKPIVAVDPTNMIDLEVDAFQRLDRLDALLGDQVACTRSGDRLRVSIVVDDAARARQVRAALAALATDRRVVVQVNTPRDLITRAKTPAARAGAVRQYTVDADRSAMQDDLRASVARDVTSQDADRLVDAEHDLARRLVATSHRALRQTWAVQRLLDALTDAEVATMRAPTLASWYALIDTHVHAYRQELRDLTRLLTTVVAPSPAAPRDADAAAAMSRDASLRALLARASVVDDAVQHSFRSTGPADPAPASVKTAAFWRTLMDAQSLAAAIDSAKTNRNP